MFRRAVTPSMLALLAESLPWARCAQPAEIANVVLSLCEDDKDYLTGQVIAVDGGSRPVEARGADELACKVERSMDPADSFLDTPQIVRGPS
jgi:Enoyl-(Acyl carrier protein) reductase